MSCRWRLTNRLISFTRNGSYYSRAAVRSQNMHTLNHISHPIIYSWNHDTPLKREITSLSRQRRKDIIPTPDTIYAVSTATGPAAIAIIRISGPACLDIYGGLCPNHPFPEPRVATLRRIRDPDDSTRVLDTSSLVLYFPAPHTATGEDLLELHIHGGPAIVRSVLAAIPQCTESRPRRRTADYSHIRAADPGEFTKRAFYNGRIDLVQAEALGEMLSAETEQQRRLAVAGTGSRLADRYEQWRNMLLHARGELEALIDFSEDQHFDESPVTFMQSVFQQIFSLRKQILGHINNASRGEMLRNGIDVALLGAPNAGKSSLLNRIVGREAAIVSNEAGTTRDIVDVTVDIGGWLTRLGDMAGLRAGEARDSVSSSAVSLSRDHPRISEVEREGMRRARERALQADLVLVLISVEQGSDGEIGLALNDELIHAVQECHSHDKRILFVANKMDKVPMSDLKSFQEECRIELASRFAGAFVPDMFFIFCQQDYPSSGQPVIQRDGIDHGGIQLFLSGLAQTFSSMTTAVAGDDELKLTPEEGRAYWTASLAVTHRQREHLRQCLWFLEDFLRENESANLNPHPRIPSRSQGLEHSHYVDNHEDLVAEATYTTVNQIAPIQWYKSRDKAELPNSLALEDLSHASADHAHHSQNYTLDKAENEFDVVTAAEHLRYAAECLAKITGRGQGGDVEDVLGVVFEK